MNVALPAPWTMERFLAWANTQEGRHEFDGLRPVAMVGGSGRHNRITLNIHAAFRHRLRGTPCSSFGPDLGVRTIGNAVRYPDALVTCTKFDELSKLAPDPIAVFEVLSPDSGRRDRIQKTLEYGGVPSIRHYVIVESSGVGVFAMHREAGDAPWTATSLTGDDILALPALGLEIPVAEFYEDVDFGGDGEVA
jgi:Uma2 family endonuclease